MAAPARPSWSGFLKLSLVTISVRLYTATSARERIHFHQIHQPSGERVHYQYSVPGIGPVEREDIVKGYEYEKGRYVTIDPDDLKRLRLDTADTIEVKEFVEADSLDPVYRDSPYYLVPDGSVAEEGYRVLREALQRTGKVAIGQVVLSGREHVVAILPYGDGLRLDTLRYKEEVRDPAAYYQGLAQAPVDPDQEALMEQIVARRSAAFDPGRFVDHYEEAVRRLIEQKLEGKLPAREAERHPATVVNLMDALKRSLAADGEAETGTHQRRAPRKGRAPARDQRHLLLPVEGGRGKAAPADAAEAPKRRRKA